MGVPIQRIVESNLMQTCAVNAPYDIPTMIRILVHFPLASVMLAMLAGSGDFNTLNRPTSNLSVDEEMWPFTQAEWKIISVSKQKTRDEAIDKAANSLPKSAEPGPDNEYLSASASEIVKNIAEGETLP